MKLQILIPQYKETDEIVKSLLDSIAIQQNIDFNDIGVIICNDGTDIHLSNKLLNNYPFVIEYYLCEHKGVSATRNACLDHAIADYVMFCDADDMFYTVFALSTIFGYIDQTFDFMYSVFIEEDRIPGFFVPIYTPIEKDATFVHGKVYRRQYLIEKNIRWKEELVINEDSYFNSLCLGLSEKTIYCSVPFYVWKWREDSVSRDPQFMLKYFNNFIKSAETLVTEFLIHSRIDRAIYYTIHTIFYTYYTFNRLEWFLLENKEYKELTEKRFLEFYNKYGSYWNQMSDCDKINISQEVRAIVVRDGMLMETITIDDWLKRIKEHNLEN